MKKIVKGNDFLLRIPVVKVVSGEKFDFPLTACSEVSVSLVNSYKRYRLASVIEDGTDNVLHSRVEGDTMPCGCYALEVKGKLFGSDWRSNEYEQIQLVDNNASADTELPDVDEGEDSVEIDTQVIVMGAPTPVLNPKGAWEATETYAVGDTVSHNCACWWAATVNTDSEPKSPSADWVVLIDITPFRDELEDSAKAADEAAANANKAAESAAATEATVTADEDARKAAETAREAAEAARVSAETARTEAEAARVTAEAKRETDTAEAITNTKAATTNAKTATTKANNAAAKAVEAAEKVEGMEFRATRNRLLLTI